MKLYFTALLIAAISCVFAQQTTWKKTFIGDSTEMATDIVTVQDGYVMTGHSNSFGQGKDDILVMKMNANANILWSKVYGNSNDQEGKKIIRTADGGFLVIGETVSLDSAGYDIVLLKLDSAGNIEWSKSYGGPKGEYVADVKDIGNGFLIIGYTWSFGAGADYMIAVVDYQGNLKMAKHYDGGAYETCFGAILTDNGAVMVGSRSVISTDYGFVMKIDTSGTVQWAKTYGGSGVDQLNSGVETVDGGYMFSGSTTSFGNGLVDYYLVKTTANGSLVWSRALGTPSWDAAYDIINNGTGFMIAGEGYTGDFNIFCVNQDGITDWERVYDDNVSWARAFSIVPSISADGYVVAGLSDESGVGDAVDIFVVKLTQNGYNCSGEDSANAVISTQTATVQDVTITEATADLLVQPITFVANNASFTEYAICAAGLPTGMPQKEAVNAIRIYPNPSQGEINIEAPTTEDFLMLRVYDLKGGLVFSQQKKAKGGWIRSVVDLSALPKSVYQINLTGSASNYAQRVAIY